MNYHLRQLITHVFNKTPNGWFQVDEPKYSFAPTWSR